MSGTPELRDDVRKAAEKIGVDLDDVRKAAEKIGVDLDRVEFDTLVAGYIVELEHGTVYENTNVTDDDPVLTLKIVMAHLREGLDYYDRLARSERAMEDEGAPVEPFKCWAQGRMRRM